MESEKTCDHYDHYDYTDDVKDIHWFMLPLKNISLVLLQRGCVHVNDTIAWSATRLTACYGSLFGGDH